MLSEYAKPFEPNKPASLDDHLEYLFYDSMAREFEENPGLQEYPIDDIANEVMLRVIAALEDRLPSEFWVNKYEAWIANQES